MPRVSAATMVPGRVVEAEELWYDPHRWPAWIDGFGHVAKLEGEWPQIGARLLWDSRPQGRGRVAEQVTAYEPRRGQTLDVATGRHGAGLDRRASRRSRSSPPAIRYK